MTDLRAALERIRDHGYQPIYNGRPSCPFCGNFVDDEQTHSPGCVLLAAPDLLDDIDVERLAAALHIVRAHTGDPSRRTIPHSHPIAEDYRQEAAAIVAALRDAK